MSAECPFAREEKRTRRERVTKRIARMIVNWAVVFLGGLQVMLAVGIAHHEWIPTLPTIGYWWSVLLVVLLRTAFFMIHTVEARAK